jgi:hypothetical protein
MKHKEKEFHNEKDVNEAFQYFYDKGYVDGANSRRCN